MYKQTARNTRIRLSARVLSSLPEKTQMQDSTRENAVSMPFMISTSPTEKESRRRKMPCGTTLPLHVTQYSCAHAHRSCPWKVNVRRNVASSMRSGCARLAVSDIASTMANARRFFRTNFSGLLIAQAPSPLCRKEPVCRLPALKLPRYACLSGM